MKNFFWCTMKHASRIFHENFLRPFSLEIEKRTSAKHICQNSVAFFANLLQIFGQNFALGHCGHNLLAGVDLVIIKSKGACEEFNEGGT